MKRAVSLLISILILFGMVVGLIFVMQLRPRSTSANIFQQPNITPSRRICAPTPAPPTLDITSTLTLTPGPNQTVIVPLEPSVTPLPISKINDLAPGLDNKDKVHVYVMRCDGTFELFLLDPNANLSLNEAVALNQGDVILQWIPPLSIMVGGEPPHVTATPTRTFTPTRTRTPTITKTPTKTPLHYTPPYP